MARYSQPNAISGASMSGPVYEPQVTPYDRDDDDVSVLQNRGPYRDDYDDKAYGQNDYAVHGNRSRGRHDDGDVWNRRDLVPTYTETVGPETDKAHRKARPWDNYAMKRKEEATAGYGELADNYRNQGGQYRQPWDDYLTVKKR